MKKHKKGIRIGLAALFVLALLLAAGKIVLGNMVREVRNISVAMPDLSEVPDGRYAGEYTVGPVHVKVEVVVRQHQMEEIVILQHDNGLGSAAESIVGEVIAGQNLDVDAVSGATVSSKCILKAVEDALENGVGNDM